MKRTGVFATAVQVEEVKRAATTPLIALHLGMPETPLQVAHRCALAQGLPEIQGYYGIDLSNGEFVSV